MIQPGDRVRILSTIDPNLKPLIGQEREVLSVPGYGSSIYYKLKKTQSDRENGCFGLYFDKGAIELVETAFEPSEPSEPLTPVNPSESFEAWFGREVNNILKRASDDVPLNINKAGYATLRAAYAAGRASNG